MENTQIFQTALSFSSQHTKYFILDINCLTLMVHVMRHTMPQDGEDDIIKTHKDGTKKHFKGRLNLPFINAQQV